MKTSIPLGVVVLLVAMLIDTSEGLYNNTTAVAACETCNVVNCYGHVIQNECCFYFAEKSTCDGCCKFQMELDPVTFRAKEVNQTCCAPIYRKKMYSTLWCHCGDDCAGKLTDSSYPGWSYEEKYEYYVVTKCACTDNDWQNYVQYSYSYPSFYPAAQTPKPEEGLMRAAIEDVLARKNGNVYGG